MSPVDSQPNSSLPVWHEYRRPPLKRAMPMRAKKKMMKKRKTARNGTKGGQQVRRRREAHEACGWRDDRGRA